MVIYLKSTNQRKLDKISAEMARLMPHSPEWIIKKNEWKTAYLAVAKERTSEKK